MRVLVAEDDPVIALGFSRRLERLGHRPIGPAHDGSAAIELARDTHPDIYMFDVTMPKVDGLAAARMLADEGLRRPLVVVTGSDDASIIDRSVEIGVSAFLTKPVDDRQLDAAIRLAAAQHAELRELEILYDRCTKALEARKLIERAKGLLMDAFGIGEQEAFRRMRRNARDCNLTLAQVASRIIEQESLIRGDRPADR